MKVKKEVIAAALCVACSMTFSGCASVATPINNWANSVSNGMEKYKIFQPAESDQDRLAKAQRQIALENLSRLPACSADNALVHGVPDVSSLPLGKHADVRAPGCPGIFTCWQYCLSGASSCDPDAMMDECTLVGPDLFPPRQAQQRPSTPVDNSSAAINLK
jgi:hypothetical protein